LKIAPWRVKILSFLHFTLSIRVARWLTSMQERSGRRE
jgi:hypothetical protein